MIYVFTNDIQRFKKENQGCDSVIVTEPDQIRGRMFRDSDVVIDMVYTDGTYIPSGLVDEMTVARIKIETIKRGMQPVKKTMRFELNTGKYRARVEYPGYDGKELVVEELVELPVDVTDKLEAKIVKSKHSDGYYVRVMHQGKTAFCLGVDNASKKLAEKGYVVKKVHNSSISFRVLKEGQR